MTAPDETTFPPILTSVSLLLFMDPFLMLKAWNFVYHCVRNTVIREIELRDKSEEFGQDRDNFRRLD